MWGRHSLKSDAFHLAPSFVSEFSLEVRSPPEWMFDRSGVIENMP